MGDEEDTVITPKDILFIGMGRSALCWYRIALPAMYLGADWVGVDDHLAFMTGIVQSNTTQADPANYKVVVWQQPRAPFHVKKMREVQKSGTKVIIEVDDYLHGVRKMKDHDFKDAEAFSKKEMLKFEKTMMLADGLICSTEWLASKYRQFNENTFVCKNGLDLGRYDYSRPEHKGINIGWSGATGHRNAFEPIVKIVDEVMTDNKEVNFVSVGQSFATRFHHHGEHRLLSVPFSGLETYPCPQTVFDINLAPARDTGWYRAKSALRYYEAAALGIPTIGDPLIYSEIKHGVTGYHASTEEEWDHYIRKLVDNKELREEMGKAARAYAFTEIDMVNRRHQWVEAIENIISD